jgi:hypothetical protein
MGASLKTDCLFGISADARICHLRGLGESWLRVALEATVFDHDERGFLEAGGDHSPASLPASALLEASDREDGLLAVALLVSSQP